MSVTFDNQAFGVNQGSVGAYTQVPILGEQYTGTAALGGTDTISVDGTFNVPGDQATITQFIGGVLQAPTTATYLGFSQAGNNPPTYYFSTSNTPAVGTAVAVSEGAVPTLNVASTIDTSATPAPAPCFVTGTRITTARGEVTVEDLAIGDLVVTVSGEHRPVCWIGHRRVACARHPNPREVWPIRVSAGAISEGVPSRDLWLSPDHAVCMDVDGEVLIPVKHLLNAATIVQIPRDAVTYWHVELEAHDVLFAEGMPAESFLDTGVRRSFENGDAPTLLHPDFAPKSLVDFCRPLVQAGPLVAAARDQVAARAEALGWSITADPDLHIIVDGTVIFPKVVETEIGEVLRFVLPTAAYDVCLVSRTYEPAQIDPHTGDPRRLGVPLYGLEVRGGADRACAIALDDARLDVGFSFVQGEADNLWRWTDGAAVLSPALWSGVSGAVTLDVKLVPSAWWAGGGVYAVRNDAVLAMAA